MNFFKSNIKIILFFLLTLFIFFNAAIEPFVIYDMQIVKLPYNDSMFFQVYASSILIAFIALCALSILDFKDLKSKHWVIATVFGIVALLPMLISATSANLSLATAVFFTYLASVTMRNQYGNKMPIVTSPKPRHLITDVSIVVTIILVWLLSIPWSSVELSFSISNTLWALTAATAEEVIFRLFLFYVIVKLSKDNNPPMLVTLLILVIPFSVWHIIGDSMQNGLLYGLNSLQSFIFTSTIISILALKRGLFAAILLHFLINFIQGILQHIS